MIEEEKITLDTSVLIDNIVSKLFEKDEIKVKTIIIPQAVISELQNQANKGKEIGFLGLEEIKKISNFCKEKNIELIFYGRRPSLEEIKLAKSGYIDALILDVARENNSALLTSDKVLYLIATALGVKAYYFGKELEKKEKLSFEDLFSEDAASVHIKEGVKVKRKRGTPGMWKLEELDIVFNRKEIEDLIAEILEAARMRKDGFIEIEREGSIIVQLGKYRIVIVKPPVSDEYEITIARPIKKLKLEDYNLDQDLIKRLEERAEGILVAGKPGSGKTTFVQALAEWYHKKGKIVKTIESPRDLDVIKDIVQYSKNFASSEELHDILLLARPDYVVFDEMRDTEDFKLYIDLRLAGVGMIGVVHAERPIDAIQRFLSRTELGMIPQIVDTIIFIDKGRINKVYELSLTVKIPTGIFSEELARPVVEVRDFITGELEYELYTFGEEIVVVPIKKYEKKFTPIEKVAIKLLEKEFKNLIGSKVKVELVSPSSVILYVPEKAKAKIIGKKGKRIERLEKLYGLRIKVKSFEENIKEDVDFEIEEKEDKIIIYLNPELAKKKITFYIENQPVSSLIVDKKGKIIISKDSKLGKEILDALHKNKEIRINIQ